jgi:hypothetical protein
MDLNLVAEDMSKISRGVLQLALSGIGTWKFKTDWESAPGRSWVQSHNATVSWQLNTQTCCYHSGNTPVYRRQLPTNSGYTELRGRMVTTSASHSGGSKFKPRPGKSILTQVFPGVSRSPSQIIGVLNALRYATISSSRVLSNSSFTNHSMLYTK